MSTMNNRMSTEKTVGILPVFWIGILLLLFSGGSLHGQFSTATFNHQKASEQYDERGFMKGKSLSVDGNLVVNNSNGNVSYSYPISSFTMHGYPVNVNLNYCGSVSFTSFQAYQSYYNGVFCLNHGWSKFSQNKPLWIIGLNGFAVQTISQNTEPVLPPLSVTQYITNILSAPKFEPQVWLVDGYDYSNRMRDFSAAGETVDNRVDVIRLLRSDGSILELCNKADNSSSANTIGEESLYSGKYFEKGTNTKGYAYVELKETRPNSLRSKYVGSYAIDTAILLPRVVHYYPGDGLEYIFREDVAPYGTQFYYGEPWMGTMRACASIFYLDEIRSEKHSIVELSYVDSYQDGQPTVMKGRKQLLEFWGHRFSFGGYRARIESFGKTTELYLDTLLRSPKADFNMDSTKYITWEATSLPMVKRIVDPEGRQVSFDYGIRTRTYEGYGWPYKYDPLDPNCGTLVTSYNPKILTKTKRLKRYNEPATYTLLDYHEDSTVTLTYGGSSAENLYMLSEVADAMSKKNYDGTVLQTKEFRYIATTPCACSLTWQTEFTMRDEITSKETWGLSSYKRSIDPSIFSYIPGRAYTDLTESIEGSDSLATVTTTSYDYIHTSGGDSMLNLRYPVSRRISEYINGDTSTKITKAYSTFSYDLDTAIRFTALVAKRSYSLAVKREFENVWRPDSTNVLLYRKVKEYQIFPDSLQTYYKYNNWDKYKSLAKYYELKATDEDFTKSWEECLLDGDPRVIVGNDRIDTTYGYPPSAIVEKGNYITDGNSASYPVLRGKILQGSSKRFASIVSGTNYDLPDRTMIVGDTVFGYGGVHYVNSSLLYGSLALQMPKYVETSLGSRTEFGYDYYNIPEKWGCDFSDGIPTGKIRRNDNTDSIHVFTGGEQIYWWHDPLGETKRVRRYRSTGGSLDTLFLPSLYERTYYGLHKGIIDANGWYTSAQYDNIGRLKQLNLPYDFNSSTHLVEREKTVQNVREAGYTVLEVQIYEKHKVPPDTSWYYRLAKYNYENYNVLRCERLYTPPDDDTGGGGSGGRKGEKTLIGDEVWRPVNDVRDTTYYIKIPFGFTAGHIESLDSAVFEISPEQIDPCFSMDVKVLKQNGLSSPTPYSLGSYQFNCDSAFTDTSQAFLSDTGYVNPNRHKLRFKFPSGLVSSIASAGSDGISFDVYLSPTVTDKAGYFAHTGDDVMPQVKLYGIFKNDIDQADYTLRYTYEDYYGSSATWVKSKVDDSLHTSNKMATSGSSTDNRRVSVIANTFRGDGSLTTSSLYHGNPSDNIKDVVTFVNNGFGKPIETADQLGYISRIRYDAHDRPIQVDNPDSVYGSSTKVVTRYDMGTPSKFGLQRVVSDSDYQDFYGYVSMTSSENENHIVFTKYSDAFGRLRREVADSGNSYHLNLITLYDYDIQGRLTRVMNPAGQITKYWYDDYGRVKYKQQPDIGIVSYAYDKAGNVRFTQTTEQDSLGKLTFQEYDDLNRITVVGEARLTNTTHDTLPNLNRLTDALDPDVLHDNGQSGILTANKTLWNDSSTYATANIPNNASESACLPEGTYDTEDYTPSSPTFKMNLTAEGSDVLPLTGATNFENIGKNPANVRIVIHYDTLPSRTGVVWGNFTPSTLTNAWNNLSPTGSVRNMKGHEVAVAYREKVNEPFHYVVMSYDERGRVEALLRFTGNIGFDAVYYKYNSANQVIRLITADGMRQHCTWYGYDGNGRLDSVWTRLGANGTGLGLTSPAYPTILDKPLSPEIVYRYDKRGLVDSTLLIEPQVVQRYYYRARKWLDSMSAISGSDRIFSQQLEFDIVGNITKQRSKQLGTAEIVMDYDYDKTNRIKLWSTSGGSVITGDLYTYDKVGNRSTKFIHDYTAIGYPTDTVAYTYGTGNNQLRQAKNAYNGVASNYWYTKDGALRVREKETKYAPNIYHLRRELFSYGYNGLLKTFGSSSWDGASIACMRDTVSAPQWQWQYRYSASGERESKRMVAAPLDGKSTQSHLWTYYLLSGSKQQLAVYNGRETSEADACYNTGHRVHFYPVEYLTYGNGSSALITTRPNDFREYKIVDHLGSTRVVLDSNGAILSTYDYEPFGRPLAMTGADSRKSFIDKEKDKESGLGNYGMRSYDDDLGLFTSIDPFWEKYRAWSPYQYGNNNPLRAVDPSGLAPEEPWHGDDNEDPVSKEKAKKAAEEKAKKAAEEKAKKKELEDSKKHSLSEVTGQGVQASLNFVPLLGFGVALSYFQLNRGPDAGKSNFSFSITARTGFESSISISGFGIASELSNKNLTASKVEGYGLDATVGSGIYGLSGGISIPKDSQDNTKPKDFITLPIFPISLGAGGGGSGGFGQTFLLK